MKHPAATVALAFAGGILAGHGIPAPLPGLFALAFALVLAALLRPRARPFLIRPGFFLVGWTALASQTAVLSPHDLRTLFGESTTLATLRGTIASMPVERAYDHRGRTYLRTTTTLAVTACQTSGRWQPAAGMVQVTTRGPLGQGYFQGLEVEAAGVLAPPPGARAEGLFDYRRYLAWQGVHYQLTVSGARDWRNLAPAATPPWSHRFILWGQGILRQGLPVEDEPLRLLWAMTLGWKPAMTDEVSDPFMKSGTMHIFAISGLHIALISGILLALLRTLQVSRLASGLVIIPLIWFYTAATGWQPSAIRSTLMMSVIIGGWALSRPSDLLNSLAVAALALLVWDPRQLFQASFQLSFFVVLSLALLHPPFEALRQRLWTEDPLLPKSLRPRWRRWLDTPWRHLSTSAMTSLAAWTGSLPLVAHYFGLVTPVSLLANLVVVPLSSLALMSNLGSLLCGEWFPWAAELFNHSAWLWMRLMLEASWVAADLPGGWFFVPPPSPLLCALLYLLLFSILTGWGLQTGRRRWPLLLATLLLAWGAHAAWEARTSIRITCLPLAGGNAIIVDAPGRRRDLLVDTGNAAEAERVTLPLLRLQGRHRLQSLLLTHGDIQHVGGFDLLRSNLPPAQVLTGPARMRSATYRRILDALEKQPHLWQTIKNGDSLGDWQVLHPDPGDRFTQADDHAVVLRGNLWGTRLLLLSDLGRQGQKTLLERHADLRADIVVTGLPSAGEPLTDSLLHAIQPRLIVVLDAEYPATSRASPALRSRLGRSPAQVLLAHEAGAITLTAHRRGGWTVATQKLPPPAVERPLSQPGDEEDEW